MPIFAPHYAYTQPGSTCSLSFCFQTKDFNDCLASLLCVSLFSYVHDKKDQILWFILDSPQKSLTIFSKLAAVIWTGHSSWLWKQGINGHSANPTPGGSVGRLFSQDDFIALSSWWLPWKPRFFFLENCKAITAIKGTKFQCYKYFQGENVIRAENTN